MEVIKWLDHLGAGDELSVGSKASNLGEALKAGFSIPPGFVLTARAYQRMLKDLGLKSSYDQKFLENLPKRILGYKLPKEVYEEIESAFEVLASQSVSVRSSAVSEDLPSASFAGIYETFLGVKGLQSVLEAIRRCWASAWSRRAIQYRERCGFEHGRVAMAVIIQQMVPADVSGVTFSRNPVTENPSEVVINSNWGLGETVVSGKATPDSTVIDKASMNVKERQTGGKEVVAVLDPSGLVVHSQPSSET